LHSFGAHRDYNGKIIISDQLINESTASHGQVSVDRYGLSTIIRPWAEILGDPANTHDGNTSNGFKQTKTDSVENGEYTKTYRAGLEDNQPDRINGGGTNSGVILFSIDMYIDTNAFVEMYASRVLYCTAVVDFISTKSITPNAKQNETI
jgi:hypothetical protein